MVNMSTIVPTNFGIKEKWQFNWLSQGFAWEMKLGWPRKISGSEPIYILQLD